MITLLGRLASEAEAMQIAICVLARGDVGRVDQLADRVRAQVEQSRARISRAAVLRALLLNGLELAEARGIAPVPIHGDALRLSYALDPIDLDRVERFRLAHWSTSTQPSLERLHGALVRLALPISETRKFARRVLAASTRPRGRART